MQRFSFWFFGFLGLPQMHRLDWFFFGTRMTLIRQIKADSLSESFGIATDAQIELVFFWDADDAD